MDCFTERIVLDAQFPGDLLTRRTALQQFLGLRRNLVGHHRRTTAAPRAKKPSTPSFRNFSTLRRTLFLETPNFWTISVTGRCLGKPTRREHPKGTPIVFAMDEYRHHPDEVRPLRIFLDDADEGIDLGGPIGDKRLSEK